MSETFGPGHFFIIITNNQSKPTLHHEAEGSPLDDPKFLAEAGMESIFSFEILNLDPPLIVHFAHPPITWNAPDPSGIQPPEVEDVTLTLTVTPGEITIDQEFHFKLHFDNGAELWSPHGMRPLDPTIIEKPPE